MRQRCYLTAMDLQVRAAQNVRTVIHLVHQVLIRIQINHLTHNQKLISDIHHFHRLVQLIHFHFASHFSSQKKPHFTYLPLPFAICPLYPLKALLSGSYLHLSSELIANWTEFLPPPPEHPPPLPLANCAQPMVCYVPTSPGSIRRAAQWANSGLPNHQK